MNGIGALPAYRAAFDTGSGYVDFELVIGGTTYTHSQFRDLKINARRFGDYGIGSVNLRTISAIVSASIAVGASVQVFATYTVPGQTSYRILHSTGVVFQVKKRNSESEILCYDKLCLTEYTFKRTPTWTDRSMLAVVQEIAQDIGVTLTPRAEECIQTFTLEDPGAMSAREILEEIAKSCAGNFLITASGELDFIPVGANDAAGFSIVTLNSSGNFSVIDKADLTAGTTVLAEGNDGLEADSYENAATKALWYQTPEGRDVLSKAGEQYPDVEVTKKNIEFDSLQRENQYQPYVAVAISNDVSSWYSPSGLSDEDWNALLQTGRLLSVDMRFGSQEIADYIYSKITTGQQFIPYSFSGNVDPALELGDLIKIEAAGDGLLYILATMDLDCSLGRIFGTVGAEGESEIETLQPYTPKVERMVRREAVERRASIEVTQDSITSEVARASAAEGELSSLIRQTATELTISFTQGIQAAEDAASTELGDYAALIEQYIRFAGALIELGERNSQFKAILTNTRLTFTGADGQPAAWFANDELHINKAVIEQSLQIDDWIEQVESNKVFSISYIG